MKKTIKSIALSAALATATLTPAYAEGVSREDVTRETISTQSGVEGVGLALIIVTVIVLAAAAGCSGKCMYK